MKKYLQYISIIALLSFTQSCATANKINKNEKLSIETAMLNAMKWQELNPIYAKAPTDWTNGAYYLGVAKAHQSTQNKTFLDALISMANRNNWKPWERFYHADDLNISYTYLYLQSLGIPNADLNPTVQIIQDHLFKAHPWKNGSPSVRTEKNEPDEKSILWWWCDALFMSPPVITSYAKSSNSFSLLAEMDKFYMQSYELLYNKQEKLFARDMRFLWKGNEQDIKEPNGKKVFWSRGNGWVLAGLALILTDMPKDYANRKFYENLFREMAWRIKDL
ncbi:MAG: glycoside hydrolase family 88 protein, partial [Bacteroidota bacterium]